MTGRTRRCLPGVRGGVITGLTVLCLMRQCCGHGDTARMRERRNPRYVPLFCASRKNFIAALRRSFNRLFDARLCSRSNSARQFLQYSGRRPARGGVGRSMSPPQRLQVLFTEMVSESAVHPDKDLPAVRGCGEVMFGAFHRALSRNPRLFRPRRHLGVLPAPFCCVRVSGFEFGAKEGRRLAPPFQICVQQTGSTGDAKQCGSVG